MARGFIKGAIWGVGVSVIAVTMLSVVDDMPEQSPAVGLASSAAGGQDMPGTNRGRDGDGPSAVDVSATDVAAPEPDTLSDLLADALSPAAVPEAGAASDLNGTALPEDTALSGIASATSLAPNPQYSQNGALQTPAKEPGYSVSTEPTQPTTPDAMPQDTAFSDPEGSETPSAIVQDDPAETAAETAEAPAAAPTPEPDTVSVAVNSQDPAQPETPTASDGTTAFAEQPEADPAASQTQPAALAKPVAGQGATSVAEALPVPDAGVAPKQPLERGPELAQTADQPRQVLVQIAQALPDAGNITQSQPPAPSTAANLPAPDPAEVAEVDKDSTPAPVEVDVAVVAPAPVPPADRMKNVPTTIAAVPDAPANAPLPEIGETEKVIPATVSVTAQQVVTTQAQATPKPKPKPKQVRVNRLPSLATITAPDAAEDAEVEDDDIEVVSIEPEVDIADQAPVERYAAPFEAPDAKPLMAVVLMDQGGDLNDPKTGLEAMAALPYPVSFAVDALSPDAAERMAAYRAAGFEVLATIDLPSGATAPDAEVNVSTALDTLPEVIGVLEGVDTGVQTTAMAGRQVAQILAETGHGLVTQNKGLNTVQKMAARQGVPSNIVFRDFDAKNQSEQVIRRFMDQGALRAGQDGGVVMLGRLREETLAALLSWSLQDRASTVAMAPVSAVLLQDQGS